MNFAYTMEPLSDTLSVCITPDHKFGTDAFLLADFSNARHKDRIVDLGTGCGIIPIILYKKFNPSIIYGLDIQEKAIEQFAYTVETCHLQDIIVPLEGDLKNIQGILPYDSFDIVTCNPPYKIANTGILSEQVAHQIARHEILCTIDDVCKTASRLLKTGGKLCLCQRPERLSDVILAMKQHHIEPKRLRLICKNPKSTPWLFLIEGKKGSAPYMEILPSLYVMEGKDDHFTEEMQRIYGVSETPSPRKE
ncbi:MAG: methyltransferase [Oscillospiraceae bacterium]